MATESSYTAVEVASVWVRNYFGYFYLWLGLICVLLLVAVALSPMGRLKLGKSSEKPEHSLWAWTAMLYSAGMGAGILLRAVQEPVYMMLNPPFKHSIEPEILALEYTFYQWGLTPWAFYGLFAMIIGYALFVRKKPVRVSASVEDQFNNRFFLGGIDIITVLTTVFGLVAAVGLGTAQILGGLNHLWFPDLGLPTLLGLASIICILAFISAWMGVNKGIKILSSYNIFFTLLLLLLVVLHGETRTIITSFFTATYHYLLDFIPMSLALGSFDPGMEFLTDWTFYYWAFWLAWAPFTGIFIARISKGRTLRQLILGVLVIPSTATFFWFSAFGSTAFGKISSLSSYKQEYDNVFTSIFVFFESFPFSLGLQLTTMLLLVGFLVTSVDSAIFVLSMFTDKGKKNPSKRHRLMWSLLILIATLALLVLGSAKPEIDVLVAAQKLLIITSLPFAMFMVLMTAVFLKPFLKRNKPRA